MHLLGSGPRFTNIGALEVNLGTIRLSSSGALEVTPSSGTFTNSGRIEMAPNTQFEVNGALSLGASSVLDLDARTQAIFSRVQATGGVTIAGSVVMEAVGGFSAQVGMVFQFLTAASRVGQFTDWDLFTPGNGTAVLEYLASGARVAVV